MIKEVDADFRFPDGVTLSDGSFMFGIVSASKEIEVIAMFIRSADDAKLMCENDIEIVKREKGIGND